MAALLSFVATLLLVPAVQATTPCPKSLNSDITVIIENDLQDPEKQPYCSSADSGVIVLGARALKHGGCACKALGEEPWSIELKTDSIQPNHNRLEFTDPVKGTRSTGSIEELFLAGTANDATFDDQNDALDWVRTNIKDFGGSPDIITKFGQSAGVGSVRALMASPKAIGEFAGAIPLSNLGDNKYGITYSKYYTIDQEVKQADPARGPVEASDEGCRDGADTAMAQLPGPFC
ncbi:Carboxylesterase- type B [Apiospora phragmitis]|uniref:Carboxylesterase- type B n=1 Tax=Apiospora phragmitis TaxID=2905665 RepID=A0ABR1TPG9_9PEZI